MAELPDLDGRNAPRLERLRADLSALGRMPLSLSHGRSVAIDDLAARYGAAYVVEGAQLGRASVRAHVERLGVAHACTYLEHREPNAWPRFVAALRASVAGNDIPRSCEAAVAAFERFREIACAVRAGREI